MNGKPFQYVAPGTPLPPSAALPVRVVQQNTPTTMKIPTERALRPGGELLGYLQTQALEFFEQNYRTLPQDGMSVATPNNPATWTMGSFVVPKSQVLVIVDYSFNIYRFSGLGAGDYVPITQNGLATQVIWDINVNGRHDRLNTKYQVIPQKATQTNLGYANRTLGAPPEAYQFVAERAAQQQGTNAFGLAGMPQRPHRPGLVHVANQYVARASETLNVSCSVINPLPYPVAFFEADIAGFLMSQQVYDQYQAMNVPTGDPNVSVIIDQTSER